MLLASNALVRPGREDSGHELRRGERGWVDPVVVIVEGEGDAELFADREELLDGIADLGRSISLLAEEWMGGNGAKGTEPRHSPTQGGP